MLYVGVIVPAMPAAALSAGAVRADPKVRRDEEAGGR
jgi:hypothetical protein